ncbi:hypothetical protein Tco_1186239 [Tanacetum coccineum]
MSIYRGDDEDIKDLKKITMKLEKAFGRKKFVNKNEDKKEEELNDKLYNGRKCLDFENPRYFSKAKESTPTLYDEKVICLGYTPMFLTHFNEALEIEKFKREIEHKIEFAYDYGSLNASYVNEKINFSNDSFQEIINPYIEKIRFNKQVLTNHMFPM